MRENKFKLTQKQSEILEWIISQTIETQKIQTVRDIAEHFEMTSKGANDHLAALRHKNFIHIQDRKFGVYPVGIKIVRSTDG